MQHAVRLGSGIVMQGQINGINATSSSSSSAAAAADDLNSTGSSQASGVTAALSIEWARYESAKLRLSASENANAELALQVQQLQASQATRLEQLDTARRLLDESKREQKLLKDELVRSGLALKAIADENFEMKSWLREKAHGGTHKPSASPQKSAAAADKEAK